MKYCIFERCCRNEVRYISKKYTMHLNDYFSAFLSSLGQSSVQFVEKVLIALFIIYIYIYIYVYIYILYIIYLILYIWYIYILLFFFLYYSSQNLIPCEVFTAHSKPGKENVNLAQQVNHDCCKQVIDTSTSQSSQTQQLYNIFHKLNCKSKLSFT